MIRPSRRNTTVRRTSRRVFASGAAAALGLGALLSTGCEAGDARDLFRAASVGPLQDGVTQVVTGLIDGVFAIVNDGIDNATADATGGATGG